MHGDLGKSVPICQKSFSVWRDPCSGKEHVVCGFKSRLKFNLSNKLLYYIPCDEV